MKPIKSFTFFLVLFSLVSFSSIKNAATSMVGKEINDFSLRNIDNEMVSLSNYKNAKGFMVVFTCNHCPFAKLYTNRLNKLHAKYLALDVPLLAINSMDTLVYEDESFERMQEKAQKEQFLFPYLSDALQITGKQFNAKHTPQAFVVWKEKQKWVVKYSGAMDSNGEHPELAKPFLANAVDDLLNNKAVATPETESFGCAIFYRKK